MELDKNKLALAASGTVGIAYVVCAIFTYLWPEVAVSLLGFVFHVLNMEKLAGGVEFSLWSAIIGLLQVVIYTFINIWIFAWIYNALIKPRV